VVIVQRPNASLIVFAVGWALNRFVPVTTLQRAGFTIMIIAGVIGSYQEISSGASWFRRVLGALVMAFLALTLFSGSR
jgi:hypothetical protein